MLFIGLLSILTKFSLSQSGESLIVIFLIITAARRWYVSGSAVIEKLGRWLPYSSVAVTGIWMAWLVTAAYSRAKPTIDKTSPRLGVISRSIAVGVATSASKPSWVNRSATASIG